jgi:hypothetical protein
MKRRGRGSGRRRVRRRPPNRLSASPAFHMAPPDRRHRAAPPCRGRFEGRAARKVSAPGFGIGKPRCMHRNEPRRPSWAKGPGARIIRRPAARLLPTLRCGLPGTRSRQRRSRTRQPRSPIAAPIAGRSVAAHEIDAGADRAGWFHGRSRIVAQVTTKGGRAVAHGGAASAPRSAWPAQIGSSFRTGTSDLVAPSI